MVPCPVAPARKAELVCDVGEMRMCRGFGWGGHSLPKTMGCFGNPEYHWEMTWCCMVASFQAV